MSPIRPEDLDRYPDDWEEIRAAVAVRSGGRCECTGQCGSFHCCGRCGAPNHVLVHRNRDAPDNWRRCLAPDPCVSSEGWLPAVQIVLTVAHLDHHPETRDLEKLLHLCQLCHNRLDAPIRAARRSAREAERAGQRVMFGGVAP